MEERINYVNKTSSFSHIS